VVTLGGTVARNARRVPGRDALVAADQRWTWAETEELVARVAGVLRARGLQHGDRFAVMAGNAPEHLVAQWAALRLGAIVVPVSARSAPPELAHVLCDSGSRLLFVDADTAGVAASAGAPSVPLGDLVEAAREGWAPVTEDQAAEGDDAFITYTSATTGAPKGVLVDHHRAVFAALAQNASMGLRDGERYLHLSPFHHSGGVVYANAVTLLGGTHVLGGAFEPGATLAVIEREEITCLLGVPTVYQLLLRHPDLAKRDLTSWRTAIFGGASMPGTTVTELLTRLPELELFQLCGQTESGPVGLFSTTAQLRTRPDSTGHQPQPFLEHRVVDLDGVDVSPGVVGELLFRGESVMKGYWGRPEATAEALRGGWLHTGDLVRVDGDGAMVLVDRLKDLIITGGQNVYSAEVEAALHAHPDVEDCAVVGEPHPDYGATVVAVVAVRDGATLTLSQVREHCAGLLAHYKIPRRLVLRPVPRNATGKLQKHLLP